MKTLEILKNLIHFKTVTNTNPEEFEKCWLFIDTMIKQIPNWSYREYISNGFTSRVYSHEKYIEEDLKEFDLYLYANIDVVGASDEMFIPRVDGENLIGRGTADMKFGAAVMLSVLLGIDETVLEKKIAFIITSDEEFGGIDGAKYLTETEGYRGKCIIGPNGETTPNNYNFEIGNKGTIHTRYTAKGIPAHGSRKWRGDNALDRMIDFYKEMKEKFDKGDENTWDSTLNLGILNGGFATNAVADEALMQLDFRYVNNNQQEEYYKLEKELCEKYNIKSELIVDATFIEVDPESKYPKMYLENAYKHIDKNKIQLLNSCGSHDIREFFKVGMVPLIFMPRSGDHHTEKEWVNISDLELLVNINTDFINHFYG